MKKTIQGQIHPNQEIRKTLEAISRGCQKVYNYFIGERKKCDKKKQKQPSKYEQKRRLKKFKDDNPKLKDIQSQILQEIVRVKVPNAWKKYEEYKKINYKAKYPRTKTDKGWYSSFSYPQPVVNGVWIFKIENNHLIIKQGAKVKQSERELKIPLELNQPIQGEIKTLTITWKDQTKMLVSFTCEVEAKSQILLTKIKRMARIDRNVRKLFANSEGWKYKNPKYWKKVEKKYIELQRELSQKEKGSNNWKKVKSEMTRMGQKVSNRMKDRNHKSSRKLVNKFDLLAFEKLNTIEMVQKKDGKNKWRKVGKYTADGMLKACWYQQAFFATYKVQETGKWIVFVNPHNTSKRCSKCGKINEKLKDEELFICPNSECDNELDRDVNAAKNILWKAQVKLGLDKRLGTSFSERI